MNEHNLDRVHLTNVERIGATLQRMGIKPGDVINIEDLKLAADNYWYGGFSKHELVNIVKGHYGVRVGPLQYRCHGGIYGKESHPSNLR